MVSAPLCLSFQHAFINFLCIQLLLSIFSSFSFFWSECLSCSSSLRQYKPHSALARARWFALCERCTLPPHCLPHFPAAGNSSPIFHLYDSLSCKCTQTSLSQLLTTALLPEEKTGSAIAIFDTFCFSRHYL